MTTYTITEDQVTQLQRILFMRESNEKSDAEAAAMRMLAGLEPNTQEPVGQIEHLDELNERWTKHLPIGTKLYIHPAPPQKPAKPFNCGEAGCSEGRCGTAECLPSYKKQAHGIK